MVGRTVLTLLFLILISNYGEAVRVFPKGHAQAHDHGTSKLGILDDLLPQSLQSSDTPEQPRKPEPVSCTRIEKTTIVCHGVSYFSDFHFKPQQSKFWIYLGASCGLIMTAGLVAGLTLGLMSMDQTNLEILKRSGKPDIQRKAAKVLPLINQHHLLLVTLLLINASCNEALPLLLDNLLSPVMNVIISVTAVLLFGEIIPQAVCSKHGLTVGALFSPLVWVMIYLTAPVSFPVAALLDSLIGKDHSHFYHRSELKELVQIHGDIPTDHSDFVNDNLSKDECTIIRGAIDMQHKTAGECMTDIKQVEMVDYSGMMNRETMQRIAENGHSRLPVYMHSKEHIVGMLLAKHLIMVNPDSPVAVSQLKVRPIPFVPADRKLYDMLNLFQRGRSHMAIVVDPKDHLTLMGILTLEDVIEELIQEEIVDELDRTVYLVDDKIVHPSAATGSSDSPSVSFTTTATTSATATGAGTAAPSGMKVVRRESCLRAYSDCSFRVPGVRVIPPARISSASPSNPSGAPSTAVVICSSIPTVSSSASTSTTTHSHSNYGSISQQ